MTELKAFSIAERICPETDLLLSASRHCRMSTPSVAYLHAARTELRVCGIDESPVNFTGLFVIFLGKTRAAVLNDGEAVFT
ncbi:hypothetical protein [Cohnella boryungensis]|uniref:Uncharacterized protein n=1 Tax=Cohnella boryungensis TaxID=768479 RepID=A0ABV8SGN5_9BACL